MNSMSVTFKRSLLITFFLSFPTVDVDAFVVTQRISKIIGIDRSPRNICYKATSSKDSTVIDHNNNPLDLSRYANVHSFNRVLEDLALQCLDDKPNQHSDVISLATLAEALVLKLEHHPTDAAFEPDIISYNTLIKVWARVAQCLSEGRGRADVHETFHSDDSIPKELAHGGIYSARDAAVRATSILEGLELKFLKGQSAFGPDVQGYNTVLDAWAKCRCKDGVEQCEQILHKMQKWSHTGAKTSSHSPTDVHVNTDPDSWKNIRPTSLTYALCMDALINADESEDTLPKLLALEEKLELAYNATNDPLLKPDIRIGNRIINAYGKSNYISKKGADTSDEEEKRNSIPWLSARKANEVFTLWSERYKNTGDEDFKPDSMTFSSLIDAYARCGNKYSIDKAQQLFDIMMKEWEETGDNRLKPSSRSFTSVITALSKSPDPSAPQKVEALLETMENLYKRDVENKDSRTSSVLKPNIRTYTAAICAWSNSKDFSKPQRALRILKKCIDEYKRTNNEDLKPNLYSYNCCISACSKLDGASFEQKSQALKIAFSVNKAISVAGLEANHFTYATLLKAVTSLMTVGRERDEVVEALFSKCVKSGYCDPGVVKNLRLAASNALFQSLLHPATDRNGILVMADIPKEWSRKVKSAE